MSFRPPFIIQVNSDLSDYARSVLVRQLYLNEVITGNQFDARIAADPAYPTNVKLNNYRLMVVRSASELQNRNHVDIVGFVSHGRIAIEDNKFGPPGCSFAISNLTPNSLGLY